MGSEWVSHGHSAPSRSHQVESVLLQVRLVSPTCGITVTGSRLAVTAWTGSAVTGATWSRAMGVLWSYYGLTNQSQFRIVVQKTNIPSSNGRVVEAITVNEYASIR